MRSPILGKVKNKEIIGLRELSAEEFSYFQAYRSELRDYVHMGELLSVALFNYDEFAATLDRFLNDLEQSAEIGYKNRDKIIFDLNRRVLNYLSGFRTFLDHSASRISASYGKEKLKMFNDICSFQYNESFAYRFLYRLRNYTQHCGMPIGNIITESFKGKTGRVASRLTFAFDRDRLLSEYDGWGRVVKTELQALDPYFDVPSLLEELVYRIGVIHIETMRMICPDISDAANFVLSLHGEVGEADCRSIIFEAAEEHKEKVKLNIFELPVQHAYWALNDLFKKKA